MVHQYLQCNVLKKNKRLNKSNILIIEDAAIAIKIDRENKIFENEIEIFADTGEIVFNKNVAIKLKSIANQQKHDELVDDIKIFDL